MLFLLLLVAKFAVVHHPANRRLRVRRDFDQIQLQGFHLLQRLVQRHHSKLFAFGADDADLTGTNLMIDSRFSSDKTPP